MNPEQLTTKMTYYQLNKARIDERQRLYRLSKKSKTVGIPKIPIYNRLESVFTLSLIKQHKIYTPIVIPQTNEYMEYSNIRSSINPSIVSINQPTPSTIIFNFNIVETPRPYEFSECHTPISSGSYKVDMEFIKNIQAIDDKLHETLHPTTEVVLNTKQLYRLNHKENTKIYNKRRNDRTHTLKDYIKFHLMDKYAECVVCIDHTNLTPFMKTTDSRLQKQRIVNTIYRRTNMDIIVIKRNLTRVKNIMIDWYKTYHNVCGICK
tara:strand:- start:1483 stop:2274 length:792 start_codon:yes stop_codon:yes gene_type:complete